VTDEAAILLHTRPYRENSLIVTALTLHEGRVSVVARGARSARRRDRLQPFTSGRMGWSGRSSLGTLTAFETTGVRWFRGNTLACAFYLSELVVRLVQEREPHPRLHAGLEWALEHLEDRPGAVLRSFERLLLDDLGYGLDFERDVAGNPIREDARYRLVIDLGFEAAAEGFEGTTLKCIGREDYSEESARRAAKVIFRRALRQHLGPKPLMSRRLLAARRT
jgi:DNA repair protein RecO (recombination protein O)